MTTAPTAVTDSRAARISALVRALLTTDGRRVALCVLLMVTVALTEGLGIGLLLPLLSLVGVASSGGLSDTITALVAAGFAALGLTPTLIGLLGVYIVVTALHAGALYGQTVLTSHITQTFAHGLRARLAAAIARADWRVIAAGASADFIDAMTIQPMRVADAVNALLRCAATLLVTLVYAGLALRLSLPLATMAIVVGGVLGLLVMQSLRLARQSGQAHTLAQQSLTAAATEQLWGLATARSMNAQDRHAATIAQVGRDLAQAAALGQQGGARHRFVIEVGAVVLLSALVAIADAARIGAAELFLLAIIGYRLLPRVTELQQQVFVAFNAAPAYHAVRQRIATLEAATPTTSRHAPCPPLSSSVAFERVWFAYRPDRPVLRDADLVIPAGSIVAIIGESGAGKSTVAALITGLLTPDSGRVTIDGAPLTPATAHSWRDQIGYVSQEPFLFHDTIAANLRWAAPDATDDDLWRALRLAAAAAIVESAPDGLQTIVGDRGARLSGGERQRIALARALARKPRLLVLDEATNALDAVNERLILDALAGLRGQVTMLLITHHAAPLALADSVYTLSDGRLVAATAPAGPR